MLRRAVAIASAVAALLAPGAASADDPTVLCVPVPVNTVGAHVELDEEELHVPAISNAELCAAVWQPVGERPPVELTLHEGCGFPCFSLVVEPRGWVFVSTRVAVYLTYEADGVPTTVPVADVPIEVWFYNPNSICVAVGNPIPECPEGSVAVVVPAP